MRRKSVNTSTEIQNKEETQKRGYKERTTTEGTGGKDFDVTREVREQG